MMNAEDLNLTGLPYLKQVSRIKHRILKDYLVPWAIILGSAHQRLGYVDCFAGGGSYADEQGNPLPGSPQIAVDVARQHVESHRNCSLVLGFVEKDHRTADALRAVLPPRSSLPPKVSYTIFEESAQDFVQSLISTATQGGSGTIIPTFFFVDPYGHPISVPVMRKLLSLQRTELLVNLMWFRLNMHLNNPSVQTNVDQLFGHSEWCSQEFMSLQGRARERSFVSYFISQVGSEYCLQFPVPFSPEDRVPGGDKRTKYYLLHFSNHPRAALLMKRVMWTAKADVEDLQFAAYGGARQLKLMDTAPNPETLSGDLLVHFQGETLTFEDIQVQTLDWPFVEQHYREALKRLEAAGRARIVRVESKQRGLKGRDRVVFP